MRVLLSEMTWREAAEMLSQEVVAIIPAGSNEQHGPHLWLQHDITSALSVARIAAEKLYPRVVITPPIAIGFSPFHMEFPGSLTLRAETLINLSLDIHRSLKRHGIQKVVTFNGHGGNERPLHIAARIARDELGLTTAFLNHWDLVPPEITAMCEDGWVPGHGSEYETSMAMFLSPEGVRPEHVDEKYLERLDNVFPPYKRFLLRSETEYSKTGVHTGNPTLATREKGEKFSTASVEGLVKFLSCFLKYGDEIPNNADSANPSINPN